MVEFGKYAMVQNRNQNLPAWQPGVILQSLQRYSPRITIIIKIGIKLNKQTHDSRDGYSVLGNPVCLGYKQHHSA